MTALLDVNVVLAAHRADHPHHQAALDLVDGLYSQGFLWCAHIRNGFIRLSTHSSLFDQPTPIETAIQAWDIWNDRPLSRCLVDSNNVDNVFNTICRQHQASGNIVYDYYLAALAISERVPLWSFDNDFSHIAELDFRQLTNP